MLIASDDTAYIAAAAAAAAAAVIVMILLLQPQVLISIWSPQKIIHVLIVITRDFWRNGSLRTTSTVEMQTLWQKNYTKKISNIIC